MINDSILIKYKKLEESFGLMNRSLIRFKHEKSPLHTFVYGGTGTGKTYFIRQYLKIYLDQDQDQNQDQNPDLRSSLVNHEQSSFTDQNQNQNQKQPKNIVIVYKDDRLDRS